MLSFYIIGKLNLLSLFVGKILYLYAIFISFMQILYLKYKVFEETNNVMLGFNKYIVILKEHAPILF